jgi:hypothetical protein
MRFRGLSVLATTSLVTALVVGGATAASAATPQEVNVLTAASATWSTSGELDVSYSWEDRRSGDGAAEGAVLVYVGVNKVREETTPLDSAGTGHYSGTFDTAQPLRLSVETYTCVATPSGGTDCSAPSLADAEWVVTIHPGETLSYTRPTPAAEKPEPTALTTAGAHRAGKRLVARAILVDRDTRARVAGPLALQRRTADGWRTVASVHTGYLSVKTPKATYRLRYAGTAAHAASTSARFTR